MKNEASFISKRRLNVKESNLKFLSTDMNEFYQNYPKLVAAHIHICGQKSIILHNQL